MGLDGMGWRKTCGRRSLGSCCIFVSPSLSGMSSFLHCLVLHLPFVACVLSFFLVWQIIIGRSFGPRYLAEALSPACFFLRLHVCYACQEDLSLAGGPGFVTFSLYNRREKWREREWERLENESRVGCQSVDGSVNWRGGE